jgi:hypothetical protein
MGGTSFDVSLVADGAVVVIPLQLACEWATVAQSLHAACGSCPSP